MPLLEIETIVALNKGYFVIFSGEEFRRQMARLRKFLYKNFGKGAEPQKK